MWLKQEFKKAQFEISYLLTTEMPTHRLIKALPRQKFNSFLRHLGLVDIKDFLEDTAEEDCGEESADSSNYDSETTEAE